MVFEEILMILHTAPVNHMMMVLVEGLQNMIQNAIMLYQIQIDIMGVLKDVTASSGSSISINMQRVVFGLKCVADGLTEGET